MADVAARGATNAACPVATATDIPRFTADASASDVAAALTTAGVATIERLIPEPTVDALLAEMQPYIDATPHGADDFSSGATPNAPGRCWPARRPASSSSYIRWCSEQSSSSSSSTCHILSSNYE